MKLPRDTESLWIGTYPGHKFPKLEGDVTVDVAIIGAGITGLTAAVLLKRAGMKVAVLEARRVAEGVSGGTTAHLTEAVDSRYHTIAKDFGEDGAKLVAASSRAAIERIASFVAEKKIECGFARVPGYLYTERESDVGAIEKEYEAARKAGLDVSLSADVPLAFAKGRALKFENQAQFHAREYLFPLADSIPGDGSHLFEGVRALDVEDGHPCRVITDGGVVTASYVIVAANVPVNTKFFLQTKIAHYRSYALAAPLLAAVPPGLYWDTDDPYHYTRTQTVDGTDYVIVGGEDHKTGQEEATEERFQQLAAYAKSRFEIGPVGYRWSSQVIEPVDGLPFIGHSSFSTRVYVATGYSGNGMTFGTVAAMLLSDTIQGRENPWKALYEATRVKPIASAVDFVLENKDFPTKLIGDRLKGPEVDAVSEVKKGEGKVLLMGGERVAVYRDPRGKVHAVSAVCTHMGCLVHFNDAEKSWDCPCHGSRFEPDGDVIDGPACKALARRDISPGPEATPPATRGTKGH